MQPKHVKYPNSRKHIATASYPLLRAGPIGADSHPRWTCDRAQCNLLTTGASTFDIRNTRKGRVARILLGMPLLEPQEMQVLSMPLQFPEALSLSKTKETLTFILLDQQS